MTKHKGSSFDEFLKEEDILEECEKEAAKRVRKKTYWNYRIVKTILKGNNYEETVYAIHEAYYDKDNKVTAITKEPVYPSGETLEELKADCDMYMGAFKKEVLIESELFNSAAND